MPKSKFIQTVIKVRNMWLIYSSMDNINANLTSVDTFLNKHSSSNMRDNSNHEIYAAHVMLNYR